MKDYLISWILTIVMQVPCSTEIKSDFINDRCFINDTLHIRQAKSFSSMEDAARFMNRLVYIQVRTELIDSLHTIDFKEVPLPKIFIDSIVRNNWAEVYASKNPENLDSLKTKQ